MTCEAACDIIKDKKPAIGDYPKRLGNKGPGGDTLYPSAPNKLFEFPILKGKTYKGGELRFINFLIQFFFSCLHIHYFTNFLKFHPTLFVSASIRVGTAQTLVGNAHAMSM